MPALPYITYAAMAASVASTVQSGRQSRRVAAAEERKAEIENIRSIRQQVRKARLEQSSVINQGAVGGVLGSTGVAGGVSSIGSQLAGNLGFMSDVADENTSIFKGTVGAAQASTNAAVFGRIGSFTGTIFSTFNTPKGTATILPPDGKEDQ